MRLVIIESPFAGDVDGNRRYLAAALRDCLLRGEAPFASHGLYALPGVLSDGDPAERRRGIAAGLVLAERADATAIYIDRGFSGGMADGLAHAIAWARPVEFRSLVFGSLDFADARAVLMAPPLRARDELLRYLCKSHLTT